jgi:hypothetical protein
MKLSASATCYRTGGDANLRKQSISTADIIFEKSVISNPTGSPPTCRACSTYVGEERCIQGFGGETWGKDTTWKTQA